MESNIDKELIGKAIIATVFLITWTTENPVEFQKMAKECGLSPEQLLSVLMGGAISSKEGK